MNRFNLKQIYSNIAIVCFFLVMTTITFASPPHPVIRDGVAAGKITVPYFMANIDEMHQKGICVGDHSMIKKESINGIVSSNPPVLGQFKILCILVEFSDKPAQVEGEFFDSLLFGSNGNSVRAYYDEISYGQLDLVTVNLPSSIGWVEAPQTYEYYTNNQNGTGAYPQNTQKLCEDLVDAIDNTIDFSNYDNDGDGNVDCLIIAHSGQGAEYTGNNYDIWSHKWSIAPRIKDGVIITSYTLQSEYWRNPNDMTIGVFSHELGHGFGLDDLYDYDATQSRGIGYWGIMAYGCWLGPNGLGSSPSHPCAFNRIKMGFAESIIVEADISEQQIEQVETSGNIYRLWTGGNISNEYFLVENRQPVGFDSYLPESGLMIWHIDENMTSNDYEWYPGKDSTKHYQVALEQADGHYDLEVKYNFGDEGDPFPGERNNFNFNAVSSPSSNSYTDGVSYIMVNNISYSDSIMQADFTIGFSSNDPDPEDPPQLPTSIELMQNYPNPFNPTTSINYTISNNSAVQLDIFNIKGQKVSTLVNEQKDPGTYNVEWNGTNSSGTNVSSGIYLYRLTSEDIINTKKMVLLR